MRDKVDFVKCVLLCHECSKVEQDVTYMQRARGIRSRRSLTGGASLDEQALVRGLENAKCGEFVERN